MKFFQDGDGRHLGFVRTVNSAVRSTVPENPTLEPNMKWIGSPVAEIWPFAYVGAYGTPILEGRGGRRGSAMAPLERAMVVSYRLSIVTVALSVTIRPQFVIECLRHSNQWGWVNLGPNLGVFPLEQTRHVGVAESEHPMLTSNCELFSKNSNLCDHNSPTSQMTDRQMDRHTLCTKVHRAVKMSLLCPRDKLALWRRPVVA